MLHSKFSVERIKTLCKQVKEGIPVKSICDQEEISLATFYNWKKKLFLTQTIQENENPHDIIGKKASRRQNVYSKTEIRTENTESDIDSQLPIKDEEKMLLDLLSRMIVEIVMEGRVIRA